MKSNIYLMLEKFFDDTIINIAKKMNYSEENILILENKVEKLKEYYPETYGNLKSCRYNKDGRTEIEYAQDLICSWIFEDYLLFNLRSNGLNIELSGSDNERKILKSTKVSSQSDLVIKQENKNFYIEVVNDYKGYWSKHKKIDLRDDKYLHLKKLSSNNNHSYLHGIDFLNKKFFFININDEQDVQYIPFHFAYKKPAYSISLKNVKFYDFSFESICNIIIKYIEGEMDE